MKKKILAVDDSSSIRKLVEFSLKSRGYSVVSAENGQIGLEALAKDDFDAVVLDINMPKIDGFEFLRRIKANAAYVSLPILILTTEGQDRDKQKAMELGATDYLVKPFKPTELITIIDNLSQ